MVLGGAAALVQLVWAVNYLGSVGGGPLTMLRFLVYAVVGSGIWLSGWVLWRSVRDWRRRKE